MKIYKWLRGLIKASALTTVMFIMQACYGSPMGYYFGPDDIEQADADTLASEDLQFVGLDNDWQSIDDSPIIP